MVNSDGRLRQFRLEPFQTEGFFALAFLQGRGQAGRGGGEARDVVDGGLGADVGAVGPGAAAARIAQLDRRLGILDASLAKFVTDTTGDPAFVKQKREERDQVAAERKQLEAQPLVVPATGSYFTLEQIRINKTLACSAPVRDAIKAYDAAVGQANVKAAAGKLPVVNFVAGGIATPADAALMMQLGAEGNFVGSGIFKSDDPAKRAAAIVEATTHFNDPDRVAKASEGLDQAMQSLETRKLEESQLLAGRGW